MKSSLPVRTGVGSALALLLAARVHAGTALPPLPPPLLPPVPKLTAPRIGGVRAAVLMDVGSGQVLLAQGADAHVQPSGLVKLMTALLLVQARHQGLLMPGQQVHVSDRAWRTPGSRMFLQPMRPVTTSQLERGLLIDGGNDAAVAIAQAVGGTVGSFVQQMNSDAAALGLRNTRFVNPDGLPQPGQYTSAIDVARLARDLIRSDPAILSITGKATYTYGHIRQFNYNPLIGQGGVDGLAVGLYGKHRWNLAASATRKDRTLVAVVLGAPSRSASASDARALLNYGWNGWKDRRVLDSGQVVATLDRSAWTPEHLRIGVAHAVTISLPSGTQGALQTVFVPAAGLHAPIRIGQAVGEVDLRAGGHLLKRVPALAASSVKRADWFVHLLHGMEAEA